MRRIVKRLGFLGGFVFLSQCILYFIMAPLAIPALRYKKIEELDRYLESQADIIFLGDSVIGFICDTDTERWEIAELLQVLLLRFYRIKQLSEGEYTADILRSYARYIAQQPHRPKAVIIPINLYLLAPHFPEHRSQYIKLRYLLENPVLYFMWMRPLQVFQSDLYWRWRYMITEERPFYLNGRRILSSGEFFAELTAIPDQDVRLRKGLVYRYAYHLGKDQLLVRALLESGAILRTNDIVPIFYLTPIPDGYIKEYLSEDEQKQIGENIENIKKWLRQEGFPVLDLARKIPDKSHFCWDLLPNCHLTESGRKPVAYYLSIFTRALLADHN